MGDMDAIMDFCSSIFLRGEGIILIVEICNYLGYESNFDVMFTAIGYGSLMKLYIYFSFFYFFSVIHLTRAFLKLKANMKT